ncbi:tetratricopeptide repeat protein [Rhizobium sp. 9T]|uniref:Ancillary SecYEG translocon subunit n=1 Tax=Rhizobium croatiense TaxID=2867516 RepID=A0ABS7LYR4_9HYPH|nr:tetratricopeptide repeat protein [Rhizobium croatiense]MBY4609736.1 tetratricopeptide repeat protein [Rhizobium croatiense]MBY4629888.1 tetratricopeptide repeat protein [Rhizobium croatiense]
MAFNDDSFIREVNEELRSDQMKGAWRRFGRYIIVAAILIVVGTAGKVLYDYWDDSRSSGAGDQFLAAMKLADENKNDEALAALDKLEKEGHGAYPVLARMRAATVQAQKGNAAAAIAAFNEIGKDNGVPSAVRDAARMRAGWLLIENGSYEQVSAAIEEMAVPGNAFRHSAREALGLAAYKAGNMAQGRQWFQSIIDDAESPRPVANRAQMMLDLITASGKAPAAQG